MALLLRTVDMLALCCGLFIWFTELAATAGEPIANADRAIRSTGAVPLPPSPAFYSRGLSSLRVGVLGNHDPTLWDVHTDCAGRNASATSLIACNTRLFATAIKAAGASGLNLLVLPEGYGLYPDPKPLSKGGFFDLLQPVGEAACDLATEEARKASPQQYALSCAAREARVHVAANIFTRTSSTNGSGPGTVHITQLVLGPDGVTMAKYDKRHLFWPTEPRWAVPGKDPPTVIDIAGRRVALLICYEGFYPFVTGDWSQMESFSAQNASAYAWSVGASAGTLTVAAKALSKKFGVDVWATEDCRGRESPHALLQPPLGTPAPGTHNIAIPGLKDIGYKGAAVIEAASV